MSRVQHSLDAPRQRPARGRTVIELAVSLIVLVVLFRAFLVGGYMIETGSMAPCLLGYHRQADCPSCGERFAVEGSRNRGQCACPNCGQTGIGLERLARHDGDHLLVDRGAFDYRPPRRWEVVVFRNPQRPTQAYVKRLIGLPGETVELRHGDVYVNGLIQTKSYATQRGMRIPVYDHDRRPDPDDPDWQPRWLPEGRTGEWTAAAGDFRFAPLGGGAQPSGRSAVAWVNYRHWVRRGGTHRTSVPVSRWPESIPEPVAGLGPLTYDAAHGTLVCRGALPRPLRNELSGPQVDPALRQAIAQLYEASHLAPISDVYGYNKGPEGGGGLEVRDLMLELRLTSEDRSGRFVVELSDGTETLQCELDFAARSAKLIDTRTGKAVRSAELPGETGRAPFMLEVSLMDRQALVAVDGRLLFEPWSYPGGVPRGATPWRPARFGATEGAFSVRHIRLFRDVAYTGGAQGAFDRAGRTLGPDEYFVLGDNSPVSHDSRDWPEGTTLTADRFLGKPLLVHLPSRKSRVQLGKWQTEVRIPELSRIRYIR